MRIKEYHEQPDCSPVLVCTFSFLFSFHSEPLKILFLLLSFFFQFAHIIKYFAISKFLICLLITFVIITYGFIR